jgi:hypothetical protein
VALLVAAGFLLSQARADAAGSSLLGKFGQTLHFEALWPHTLSGAAVNYWLLVPALAALSLLSGAVVYFASEKQ